MQVRGESAAQDLVNVLGVVEAAPDLRDLLQRVERDFNKYAGGVRVGGSVPGCLLCLWHFCGWYTGAHLLFSSLLQCRPPPVSAAAQPRRADGAFAELLPWLLEQTQDWEVAATANCAGDTPLVRVSEQSWREGRASRLARAGDALLSCCQPAAFQPLSALPELLACPLARPHAPLPCRPRPALRCSARQRVGPPTWRVTCSKCPPTSSSQRCSAACGSAWRPPCRSARCPRRRRRRGGRWRRRGTTRRYR